MAEPLVLFDFPTFSTTIGDNVRLVGASLDLLNALAALLGKFDRSGSFCGPPDGAIELAEAGREALKGALPPEIFAAWETDNG